MNGSHLNLRVNEFKLKTEPDLPADRGVPIALVGCGGIIDVGHMPAYRKAGFNVIGCYDINQDQARATAHKWGIPRVFASIDEVAGSQARIIDIAIPAVANLEMVQRLAPTGKALLIQKPMAEDYATASRIVEEIEKRGIIAAVNQQLRWMPHMIAVKDLIRQHLLGELLSLSVQIRVYSPWHLWEWLKPKPRMEILYHSIHYMDLIRHLAGCDPLAVFSDGTKEPGSPMMGETRTLTRMFFGPHLRGTIWDEHGNIGGRDDQCATVRAEGDEGSAVVELGLIKNYPQGVADEFRFMSQRIMMDSWVHCYIKGTWFPDAFIGPMSDVMRALSGEIERPATDVRDVLKTMRLAFACYRSMEQGRKVLLEEMDREG